MGFLIQDLVRRNAIELPALSEQISDQPKLQRLEKELGSIQADLGSLLKQKLGKPDYLGFVRDIQDRD